MGEEHWEQQCIHNPAKKDINSFMGTVSFGRYRRQHVYCITLFCGNEEQLIQLKLRHCFPAINISPVLSTRGTLGRLTFSGRVNLG